MTPYTRAIDAVSRELNPSSPQSPITRNKAEKVVRAVLGAIREPDEAMNEALSATGKMWRELDSKTVWQTYIDAITASGEGK